MRRIFHILSAPRAARPDWDGPLDPLNRGFTASLAGPISTGFGDLAGASSTTAYRTWRMQSALRPKPS
jgi:hypothetical protein